MGRFAALGEGHLSLDPGGSRRIICSATTTGWYGCGMLMSMTVVDEVPRFRL